MSLLPARCYSDECRFKNVLQHLDFKTGKPIQIACPYCGEQTLYEILSICLLVRDEESPEPHFYGPEYPSRVKPGTPGQQPWKLACSPVDSRLPLNYTTERSAATCHACLKAVPE